MKPFAVPVSEGGEAMPSIRANLSEVNAQQALMTWEAQGHQTDPANGESPNDSSAAADRVQSNASKLNRYPQQATINLSRQSMLSHNNDKAYKHLLQVTHFHFSKANSVQWKT